VPLKAAFFDVGDTLVEHWAPPDVVGNKSRARICAELGEPVWIEEFLSAEIQPVWARSLVQQLAERRSSGERFEPEDARQETMGWYRHWFERQGIALDGLDPIACARSCASRSMRSLRWWPARSTRCGGAPTTGCASCS
jgi:FMN phosphatase YigB (HAD superfamily)